MFLSNKIIDTVKDGTCDAGLLIHEGQLFYSNMGLQKVLVFLFFFIWVRATLPRLRYDQLMALGWKVFLPLATLNALVTAILVVVLADGRTLTPATT